MILDAQFNFADQQSLSGTSEAASTNVYDLGAAAKLFEGTAALKAAVHVTAAGGTSPTFRAKLVGADNAALTTNPVILADTGTSAVIAATDIPLLFELQPGLQNTAKRYYGFLFTLGGTSPTATVNAQVAADAHSAGLR